MFAGSRGSDKPILCNRLLDANVDVKDTHEFPEAQESSGVQGKFAAAEALSVP